MDNLDHFDTIIGRAVIDAMDAALVQAASVASVYGADAQVVGAILRLRNHPAGLRNKPEPLSEVKGNA